MHDLNKLWQLVIEVWQNGFAGVDVGRFFIAISIFLGFLILRGLFVRFVIARLRSITQRTANQLDDTMVNAFEPPLRLVPLVMGIFFATQYLQLTGVFSEIALNA